MVGLKGMGGGYRLSTPTGSYTYDANGNTLTDASGKSYTCDFENRLVSAVVPGTGTLAFKYDPFGRRIQNSSPIGTTNYLYDGKNLLEEADQSGNVLARYTQTEKIDEQLAELHSGGTSYYEADGLGSVTSLSSSAGAVANTYTYDSFGNLTNFTGTLSNPFRYTGREFDSETGAYYYRARYYNPTSGRFISEDPIKFKGGINFYAYVHNDPADLIDALGLCDDKNCTLYISCGPTPRTHGFDHCTVTIQTGPNFTAYDGEASGSILWSQLMVKYGPTGAPPSHSFFSAPVSCNCAKQEADAINSGHWFYNVLLQNSNTAAWMLAANCGLNPRF
jgi:RHS repeat-associated protein